MIKSLPHKIKLIGVAEPVKERRERVSSHHSLDERYVQESWKALLDLKPEADIAIICTQDKVHFEPTMKALDLGYHVLLENRCLLVLKSALKW